MANNTFPTMKLSEGDSKSLSELKNDPEVSAVYVPAFKTDTKNYKVPITNLSDGSNVKYAGAVSEIDLSNADMKIYRDRIQNPTIEYSKLYIKNEYDSNKTYTMVDSDAASGYLFKLASGPIVSQEIPHLGPNMQLLSTEIINIDRDYVLNIEEGKSYVLKCVASATINLTTNITDHPVYTIICINADGSGSCPSVSVNWQDEALGNCQASFEFEDALSNAEYLMHVYIQKLYREASQQSYSVARVMDYPVAYRKVPEEVDTSYDSVVQVGAAY
jgi:hypothetical protein